MEFQKQWSSLGIDLDCNISALKLFPVICCNGLRKNGHGLKLENIGYSFDAYANKNHEKICMVRAP